MEIKSGAMPGKAFQILQSGDSGIIEFFDNVIAEPEIDKMTGRKVTIWRCEKYVLTVPYFPGLAAEIENNYAVWLKKAKDAELAAEAEKVRNYRDNLLNTCDTVYCNAEKWAAMTADQQQAWATYKQALRDVPTQVGVPYTVSWPAMPAEGGTT